VSWSPDGETLATGSDDKTVKLWEQWDNLDRFLAMGCYWTANYRTHTNPDPAVNALCQRPEVKAQLPEFLRLQAIETAKTGNYTAAVAFLPNLPADLDQQLRTLASDALVQTAQSRVSFNNLTDLSELYKDEKTFGDALKQFQSLTTGRQQEGLWLLKRAKTINPQLKVDSQELEKTLNKSISGTIDQAIKILVDQGDELAKKNDRAGAMKYYNYALQLDPKRLNPEAQFQKVQGEAAAQKLTEDIKSLATQGNITEALAKFHTLEATYPKAVDADTLGILCWAGALNGQAAQVLYLCDQAVTLSKDDPWIRNSRGLARALTGNPQGAIR
jgi:tetratricopeptide (TPR) repeat protein